MSKLIKAEYRILTEDEIAKMQADAEEAERLEWLNISYEDAVHREVRKKYTQQAVEAIINNCLSCPENTEYVREFLELQEYRAACKVYVKEMMAKYGRSV